MALRPLPLLRRGRARSWARHRHPRISCCEPCRTGKPTPQPSSWRGWKTRPWIRLLSGTMLPPSTAAFGAARWTSSLRVCALQLYGCSCDHEEMADNDRQVAEWPDWDAYPESWPKPDRASLPLDTDKRKGELVWRDRQRPRRHAGCRRRRLSRHRHRTGHLRRPPPAPKTRTPREAPSKRS